MPPRTSDTLPMVSPSCVSYPAVPYISCYLSFLPSRSTLLKAGTKPFSWKFARSAWTQVRNRFLRHPSIVFYHNRYTFAHIPERGMMYIPEDLFGGSPNFWDERTPACRDGMCVLGAVRRRGGNALFCDSHLLVRHPPPPPKGVSPAAREPSWPCCHVLCCSLHRAVAGRVRCLKE